VRTFHLQFHCCVLRLGCFQPDHLDALATGTQLHSLSCTQPSSTLLLCSALLFTVPAA
jgi:hypothetical protein